MSKVEQEIQEVLKKNNSTIGYEMVFPIYRVLPDEVKLALRVLGKHGMKIVLSIKENKSLARK